MSDFISRSALIKKLREKSVKDEVNTLSTTYTYKELAYIICNIPAAYDVEKVLQKLREVTKYNVDCYEGKESEVGDYDDSWNDDIISANETIDIVKAGGIDE